MNIEIYEVAVNPNKKEDGGYHLTVRFELSCNTGDSAVFTEVFNVPNGAMVQESAFESLCNRIWVDGCRLLAERIGRLGNTVTYVQENPHS